MNKTSNRNVKVTFKAQQAVNPQTHEAESYVRPPFYTTEHNLDNVKRLHGKIFKEAVYVDQNGNEIPQSNHQHQNNNNTNTVVEKIVEKIVEKEVKGEFTDEDVIILLSKKGKTNNSIARTLDISISDVEKILNKNLTVA